jgi:Asp-tRNA(Asn)/Glu-tRNA(Gln) amidotransferase A subunit family amidase
VGALVSTAAAIARGELSSEAAVGEALERAEASQPSLNAFTMLFAGEARASAKNPPPGPLSGVPVAVKDLFDMAGVVSSGACRAYADNVATANAPTVQKLLDAGAIVIGKTNQHELAFGATSTVSSYGRVNNPWDVSRMPGGSSGGSAAVVAAGVVGLALGSDTGGSVRIPSSFCGVSGLKTTHGLIPLDGVMPMAPSLDTVGPIASDVTDLALAMRVLTGIGAERRDDFSGLRVGVPNGLFFEGVDAEIEAAVRSAADAMAADGAVPVPVKIGWLEEANHAWASIALREFARAHPALFERPDLVDTSIMDLARLGASLPPEGEKRAHQTRADLIARFEQLFTEVDVMVAPTTPIPPPRHDETIVVAGGVELLVHAGAPATKALQINVPGLPSLALPCGMSSSGLPIGLQLIGSRHSDARLLGIGAAFQRVTDHHRMRPA